MEYRPSRTPRIILGSVLAGFVVWLLFVPPWGVIKKAIFEQAFDHCSTKHGFGEIEWTNVPAFDAAIYEITIDTPAEVAMLDCLTARASLAIKTSRDETRKSPVEGGGVLRTIESGSQFAPPQIHFQAEYTQFTLQE